MGHWKCYFEFQHIIIQEEELNVSKTFFLVAGMCNHYIAGSLAQADVYGTDYLFCSYKGQMTTTSWVSVSFYERFVGL
jgi:hypothetical protein